MEGLMLGCGGKPATMTDLKTIPLPALTETYQPVAHHELIDKVIAITTDVLPVKITAAGFGLGKGGQHLFAHLRFANGKGAGEMGLCIGIVNSYDKHLCVRIAAGANVFVCDNLMITGDITYMRKHTKKVWGDLEEAVYERITTADQSFDQALEDAQNMKLVKIEDEQAYQVLGSLYGRELLTNPMMTVARKEWREPTHATFKPRTQWSLYNSVNQALKLARPEHIMERHTELHEIFTRTDFRFVAVS